MSEHSFGSLDSSSLADSTWGTRLVAPQVQGELPEPLDYEDRAISLKDLKKLFNKYSKDFIPDLTPELQILNTAASCQRPDLDQPCKLRITTTTEHRLYPNDQLFLETPDERPSRVRVRILSQAFTRESQELTIPSVLAVIDANTFETRVPADQLELWKEDTNFRTPLNMHKLCGEAIIPLTTLEECVVHLTRESDVVKLLEHLVGDGGCGQHFHLSQNLRLPNGSELSKGLTVQGRLTPQGYIRRGYWKKGANRMQKWLTKQKGWPCTSTGVTLVPDAHGEVKVTSRDEITVGSYLVLRSGVSYAEVCRGEQGLRVKDFVSHNWSESSYEFLATMCRARVIAAWICTFAINQHCVPPLNEDYKDLPFYKALEATKDFGRVVMATDDKASTLTRIWCVFECWVAAFLGLRLLLFLPDGEVNFWSGSKESANVSAKIEALRLENAKCSVEHDKQMIEQIIGENGGMRKVEWQVKRKLSMGAVLFLACLVSNTSNFLFSLPWISSCSRSWFRMTFDDRLPMLETSFVYIICFGSAVVHLQYWVFFVSGVKASATLRSLFRTLSMDRGSARVLGLLALLELLNVACIFLSLLVRDPTTQNWVDILLCEERSELEFAMMTVYMAQKTLPWVAGYVAYKCKYTTHFREFLPAVPCFGFLLTLGCVTFFVSPATSGGDFCTNPTGTDLTKVPFGEEWPINILVCGLCAWAVSVLQRFVLALYKFARRFDDSRISRILIVLSPLILLAVVMVVLWWFNRFQALWDQRWRHMEVGFAIWVVCSTLFHRNFLKQYVQAYAKRLRCCRSQNLPSARGPLAELNSAPRTMTTGTDSTGSSLTHMGPTTTT